MVARQPAVELRIAGSVAFDAEAHLEAEGGEAIHAFNLPVALPAFDLSPSDVGKMLEFNEIRHVVGSHPRDRGCGVIVFFFFPDLRVRRNDVLMAEEAFLHCRDSRPGRTGRERMAEPAVDRFHPRVHPMAEGDRLLGPEIPLRVNIKEKGHPRCKEKHKQGQGEPHPPGQHILISPFFRHPSHQSTEKLRKSEV